MDYFELKDWLYDHNVPEAWYSINDGIKPDAYVAFKNYDTWECFYCDERYTRIDTIKLHSIDDACLYIMQKMEAMLSYSNIQPREKES